MSVRFSPGPCMHCGKDIDPGQSYVCNHCGGPRLQQTHEDEPRQPTLAEWLDSTEDKDLPATLVRTYAGRTQGDATLLFAEEARLLATRGYQPTAQSWADGRPGVRRVVMVGLFANALRPDGSLTVTYVRSRVQSAMTADERPSKRCPDCAEDVLLEARICRFCRHEFT